MDKVSCLKGILGELSGQSVSDISGDTINEVLSQMIPYVKVIPSLADVKFIITVTATEDPEHEGQMIYSSDKTLAEILAAQEAGSVIECHYNSLILNPLTFSESSCTFGCEVMSTSVIAEKTTVEITASSASVTTLRHTLTPAT